MGTAGIDGCITYTKDNIPRRKAESRARAGVHALQKGQENKSGCNLRRMYKSFGSAAKSCKK